MHSRPACRCTYTNPMHAITIAGGEGQRLRPYTEDRPKPMVPVGGKPILEHQVDWLRDNGVTHVVVACGYMHEVIEDYFGDGRPVSASDVLLDRAQRRWAVAARSNRPTSRVPGDAPFVIATNGDNINAQPLAPDDPCSTSARAPSRRCC